jgi:predicted chitinase
MADMKQLLNAAMDAVHMDDDDLRAGTAAICMVEGPTGQPEISYAHTSLARIRQVFRRLDKYSDDTIEEAKRDPEKWFELVYGDMYGNDEPGDGYKFRGRGPIQLTFKGNYQQIGKDISVDLVRDPDKVCDPHVGALVAAAYMKRHASNADDFDGMLKAVGNNTPDIRARKQGFYDEFSASGEFDYDENRHPEPAPVVSKGSQVDVLGWLKRQLGL